MFYWRRQRMLAELEWPPNAVSAGFFRTTSAPSARRLSAFITPPLVGRREKKRGEERKRLNRGEEEEEIEDREHRGESAESADCIPIAGQQRDPTNGRREPAAEAAGGQQQHAQDESGCERGHARGEPWLTAALPMDNPYCSCKLTTRVRSILKEEMAADMAARRAMAAQQAAELSECRKPLKPRSKSCKSFHVMQQNAANLLAPCLRSKRLPGFNQTWGAD